VPTVEVEELDDVSIVAVSDEVDLSNATDLRGALARMQRPDRPPVLVDLWEVTFLESVGLAVLLGAHRRARRMRHGFAVVAPPDGPVARLLKLTGLSEVLLLFGSRDAAREAVLNPSPLNGR
jgi:anti-anti-sigma factor